MKHRFFDMLLFLNGLPIVLIELKSPSREETDASEAYRQIRNYMREVPSLFIYNAICVMSDQLTSKAGTITSGEDRFMEWKTKDGNYIDSLVRDIIEHYESNRACLLTGKAMVVAYSRPIAMKIYRKMLELRPIWTETVAVVMTSTNDDDESWRSIIGNKHRRDELAAKFKDNTSPLKIAIVVDMWLTGFDVPSLATMYIYKPMAGHNLMQAIARVNRVFQDKEGGLVVDYIGIMRALKQAMNDYTSRDKKQYGDTDILSVAYPTFLEKLSICQDLLHGYDYSMFMTGTDLERAKAISGAVNFLMAREKEKQKDAFLKEAFLLRQALSLCSSVAAEPQRFEAAFFEAVRVLLVRLSYTGGGKRLSLPELNAQINALLMQSIKSSGVVNLFSDISKAFSLFSPGFLEEIANMKERNLAVELLKRLLAEQVHIYQRYNVVKSEKFSKMLQQTVNTYLNGMLTNEEVIAEMLKLARQITEAEQEGKQLGLSAEESAFYDALTKPEAIKDFYKNDELIAMTKALTETLRKNKTIDWSRKAGARAHMRMLIKRLLKKYDYPPAGVEDAVETVMSQCEVWTDNLMELDSSAVISSNTTVQKENVKAAQTTNSKATAIKDTVPTQSYTDASLAAETIPMYGSKP